MKKHEEKLRKTMSIRKDIHWKTPFKEKEAIDDLKNGLKKIGWDESFENYWSGLKEIIQSDKANKAFNRTKKLGYMDLSRDQELLEEKYNDNALVYLRKAKEQFINANKKIKKEDRQNFNQIASNNVEFKKIQNQTIELIESMLCKEDIEPIESEEVIKIFGEKFKIIESDGFDGLVNHMNDQIDELIKIRQDKDKDRGREHHSPLKWWKYVAIGGLVVGIAGILWIAWNVGGGPAGVISLIYGLIEDLVLAGLPVTPGTVIDLARGDLTGIVLGSAFNAAFMSIITLVVTGCM
jgi:hypothetical protein